MAGSKNTPDVFISYSHSDGDAVLPEIHWLESRGVCVWYDQEIRAGEVWRDELAQAIGDSGICLFFVSPRSVESSNCRKEVHFALSLEKPLVVVHLEETLLPAGLELALSDIQAILAYQTSMDDARERLLGTIDRLLGAGAHRSSEPQIRRSAHAAVAPQPVLPVVTVLPLENVGEPETRYFSDGLSEEIIKGLARHPEVTVISRASSFRFRNSDLDVREIGNQLGANHIVTGSLHAIGDELMLNVELIDQATGGLVWSERYRRPRDDAFSVQSLITQEIISVLDVTQTEEAGPETRVVPAAYDAFLEARHFHNRNDFDSAARCAERAIELDPSFSDAYAILADMHSMKVWYWLSSLSQELPSIRYYSNLARSLAPESHLVETQDLFLQFFVDHQYAEALQAVRELVADNPVNHALHSMHSVFLMSLRDLDGAVAALDRVIAGDPLASAQHRLRAERLTLAGRYEEARETLDHTARLGMRDPMQYGYLAFMQGDAAGLHEQLPLLEKAMGEDHIYYRVSLGRLKFIEEDFDGAGRVLADIDAKSRDTNFQYMQALVAQLTGRVEDYLEHMENALDIGEYTAFQNYTLGGIWQERYPELENSESYQGMLQRQKLDDKSVNAILLPA